MPAVDSNSLVPVPVPVPGPRPAATLDEVLTPQLVQSYLALQLHRAALDLDTAVHSVQAR